MGIKTDEIIDMLNDCNNRESKLSDWEKDFIQTVYEQDFITDKKKEKLDLIWERIT